MTDEQGPDDPNRRREPPEDPGTVAPETERVGSHWEATIADMEATAAAHRDDGWTVLELHPGDVVGLGPDRVDRWGLDVLVPDDEFRDLQRWVEDEGVAFDACEVYRAVADDVVFLVVAMQDTDADRAVVYPAYYDPGLAEGMLAAADAAGEMRTHVRPLDRRLVVTFTHDDPDLFRAG